MKYRVLLVTLRVLVYAKRVIWWLGSKLKNVFRSCWRLLWGAGARIVYRISYFFKRLGLGRAREWLMKRDVLQLAVFAFLLGISWSHTKLAAAHDLILANQKTVIFRFISPDEQFGVEEVLADNETVQSRQALWQQGVLSAGMPASSGFVAPPERDVSVVAGGAALTKPILIPGGITTPAVRTAPIVYSVEPGDSIGSIARDFGVSIETILWENNLTARSIIRPGNNLTILPVSGVTYVVRRGDTLLKIAKTYRVQPAAISEFNNLDESGANLKAGVKLIIPGGIKPAAAIVSRRKQPIITSSGSVIAAPPGSNATPSASGFVWPAGVRYISQYFSSYHKALDIAGPWQTAIYAAKFGTVEKAQCGWNGGYGCYVIINHGGGVKSIYAHDSQLLVTVGETVETGQTIALMGNSGNVRGRTGIHLHFEIIINGTRVNALGYVRP